MKPINFFAIITGLVLATVAHAGDVATDANQFWPQWRGPLATGVGPMADPPVSWSETEHVKWKVKVPGSGDSTPIVWGDRIFLLTAIPTGKKSEAKSSEPPATPSPDTAAGGGGRQRGRMNSELPNAAYQFAVLCLDRKTGKTLW